MTRGGGGVSQKVILHDEGGGGVQTPPKNDDIICEQPLIQYNLLALRHIKMVKSIEYVCALNLGKKNYL